MKCILAILQAAGGWNHGLHLRIENPPYLALVIEAVDESGPCGLRDHTTRRAPRIRGVKLGPLMRYRITDVDEFLRNLLTSKASQPHSL